LNVEDTDQPGRPELKIAKKKSHCEKKKVEATKKRAKKVISHEN